MHARPHFPLFQLAMAKQAVKDTEDEITALEKVLDCALCVVRS